MTGYDIGTLWMHVRVGRAYVQELARYAVHIVVPHFRASSVFGFALVLALAIQILSGILLALLFVPDPTFVMTVRCELQNEVWGFWGVYRGHVTGVDCVFTLSYLHMLRKIYLKNYMGADADGWISGTYAFLVFHVVVFLGITLSTNHLGDLTLTIGANIF
jgi:ubiquinol-cytochrome c reductase cytochrome b subunit